MQIPASRISFLPSSTNPTQFIFPNSSSLSLGLVEPGSNSAALPFLLTREVPDVVYFDRTWRYPLVFSSQQEPLGIQNLHAYTLKLYSQACSAKGSLFVLHLYST